MEVKIDEQQDEDITFSNTDTNGKIVHILHLTKRKTGIHYHDVDAMNEVMHSWRTVCGYTG